MGFKEALKSYLDTEVDKPSIEDEFKRLGITVMADRKFAERQRLLGLLLDDMDTEAEHEEPKEYVKNLKTLLNNVNRGIHVLAAPYYQGLDNMKYHRLMRGWSTLHKLAKLCISTVEARIKGVQTQNPNNNEESNGEGEPEELEVSEESEETEEYEDLRKLYDLFPELTDTRDTIIDIKTLVQRLATVLDIHVFNDAHLILLQAYSGADVRERWATVINQPPAWGTGGGFGTTMPTSGGDVSETYPRKPQGGPYPETRSSKVKRRDE